MKLGGWSSWDKNHRFNFKCKTVPTGAQEVALWVCPSGRPSVIMLNSALNLHDIMQQS